MSDFYSSRNNASVLLKTRRRGRGTAESDSTSALLPANKAGVCSPSAAFAAANLPAQLAPQGRQDPQASGSALSLHLPPQQLPVPFLSPVTFPFIHLIPTSSPEVKHLPGDFSLIRAFNFVILSPRTLNKRNSCLYYYAGNTWHNLLLLHMYGTYNLVPLSVRCQTVCYLGEVKSKGSAIRTRD